jgi:lipopolysaccharide export system protein LptC
VNSAQTASYQTMMDDRFRLAARHSRLVRFLRLAIPALIAAALLVILVVSVFNPFRMLVKLPVDIGNINVSGTKITMQSPHLAGFTPDRRPYELWAATAIQDVTDPDHVELQTLKAKVTMVDTSVVDMDAKRGTFNSKDQLLDVYDDIFLKSSTGYEARLTQARVDIAKGNVTSDQPVAVKLLNGTLDGKRMTITDNGALLRFDGGVSMILITGNSNPAPASGQAAKPDHAK